MDQFLTGVPTTIIGWISTIILVIAAIIYTFSKIRANDLKILRDTNKDQGDRIKVLEDNATTQNQAIELLQAQVKLLETRNKTLEDLVTIALKQYFFEHPDISSSMQDKIMK